MSVGEEGAAADTTTDLRAIQTWFPTARKVVGIIGSRSFHDPFTPSICRYLGEALWSAGAAILTTNGEGISEFVAWSYTNYGGNEAKENAFHLMPVADKKTGDVVERSSLGWILTAGTDEEECMNLFARVLPVYILIEGGPRSAAMARVAMEHGAVIIPVVRTGGAACGMFGAPFFYKPSFVPSREWLALRDPWEEIEATISIIVRTVQALYGTTI